MTSELARLLQKRDQDPQFARAAAAEAAKLMEAQRSAATLEQGAGNNAVCELVPTQHIVSCHVPVVIGGSGKNAVFAASFVM